MNERVCREVDRDERPNLTPMIDVTFLLLVFFLFTIKFKVLEGTLSATLPKGIGCASTHGLMLETLDLVMTRDDESLSLTANGRPVRGVESLATLFADVRARLPKPVDAELDDPLTLKIDARDGVLHEDVVAVVDRALAQHIDHIVFRGESGGKQGKAKRARKATRAR